MSKSRRKNRANGMGNTEVRKALESQTPLNDLYSLIPENRRKALDRFVRLLGKRPEDLQKALKKERLKKNKI